MLVLHDGKVYLRSGDKMVGVDITPSKITKIEGTETKVPSGGFRKIEKFEVLAKFNVSDEKPYKFPSGNVSLDDLKKKAKSLGIKYVGSMTKDTILEKIAEIEQGK